MYIIDKNKDYYDHYSHIYGVDKNIVFDRRGSVLINNDNLVLQPENRFIGRDEIQYILLETGMVQYLIKIDDIKYRKAPHKTLKDSFNLVFDSAKFEIVKKFENYKNIFGKAISIHSVYNDWFSYLDYVCGTKSKKIDYLNYRVTDEISIDLPILANTFLTRIINAEDIWKDINTYISSLNNDKDIKEASDIEKIVNHGFDKKESFRGKNK